MRLLTCCCPGHDVVVLAVALACTLKEETEVWASFGTRKAFCFLAHETAPALGPEKAQALPTTEVSCFDRLRHGLLLCRTWKECMGGVSWPRHSFFSQLHRIILMKMLRTPSTGSSYCLTTEQAPQPIYCSQCTSQRHKLQRKAMSSRYHWQVQPCSSTFDEQYTRADMSGVRPWFLHQHCHHWPTNQDQWRVNWTTLPEASKIYRELVSCKCKDSQGGLREKCKCKKARPVHLRWRLWTLPDSEQWTYLYIALCSLSLCVN